MSERSFDATDIYFDAVDMLFDGGDLHPRHDFSDDAYYGRRFGGWIS